MSGGLWPNIRAAKDGVYWAPAGTLYTVNGTLGGDPFLTDWPQFPGMLARMLMEAADGMWIWQPIGYPALITPMKQSIEAGISRPEGGGLLDEILERPVGDPIVMAGYSQGAIVVNHVWRDDILNPEGRAHHRLSDVKAIILWGDPNRSPGICRGNLLAGKPMPKNEDGYVTGGISGPDCLTPEQTPEFLYSRNNDGDLYGSAPIGTDPWRHETRIGHDERLVYEAVMEFTGRDFWDWTKEIFKNIFMPWSHFLPMVHAIKNGLDFAGSQGGPHAAYEVDWAVRHMVELGNELRAA